MKKIYLIPFFILLILFLNSCSGSKESYKRTTAAGSLIRVLLDEEPGSYEFISEAPFYLKNGDSYLALVNPGNKLVISNNNDEVEVVIGDKNFSGKYFQLTSRSNEDPVAYRGGAYRGTINIVPDGSGIHIINELSLEEYLKGVIPKEMPSGRGNEYYEALKAFTICARTYTITKLKENKKLFDVFADTRDQVYGGSGIEKEIINNVVDETRGLILTYDDKPAVTFYSSTCGGHTEDAANVFKNVDLPYLKGVKDGDEPYCSISPKFTWTETFPEAKFIERLVSAGYLDNSGCKIQNININSTFRSGRINELVIDLTDNHNNPKSVSLYGNNIRYVLKTSGNSILESNIFMVARKGDDIIINGRGYGHGVGLCQWGALEQSKEGRTHEEILSFYYPGTKIEKYNDQ